MRQNERSTCEETHRLNNAFVAKDEAIICITHEATAELQEETGIDMAFLSLIMEDK